MHKLAKLPRRPKIIYDSKRLTAQEVDQMPAEAFQKDGAIIELLRRDRGIWQIA